MGRLLESLLAGAERAPVANPANPCPSGSLRFADSQKAATEKPKARGTHVLTLTAPAATETPESRWPEYAAALRSGALMACVYCRHYDGPPDTRALGHCRAFDVESCPVTPFTCRRFERLRR